MLKNKKAQETSRSAEKVIFWAIGVGAIGTILFFAFYYVMGSYASKEMATVGGLETEILVQRFLESPKCFTYFDAELQRPFPGMILASRFTEKNLNSCYSVENKKMPAFSLALRNDAKETAYINTLNWAGADFNIKKEYPVLINNEGNIKRGILVVKVQNYR
ncbi:hypothetical protein JXA85_07430 [Candidatus Woesearchaeota archaeon]|nr:hypothetical protein [Candidatus Woesearchaeota archaeon]